jgi:hypothetical protein
LGTAILSNGLKRKDLMVLMMKNVARLEKSGEEFLWFFGIVDGEL